MILIVIQLLETELQHISPHILKLPAITHFKNDLEMKLHLKNDLKVIVSSCPKMCDLVVTIFKTFLTFFQASETLGRLNIINHKTTLGVSQ